MTWIILNLLDLRKRGKRFRVAHIQKLQHGSILVSNSVFCYVFINALGGTSKACCALAS